VVWIFEEATWMIKEGQRIDTMYTMPYILLEWIFFPSKLWRSPLSFILYHTSGRCCPNSYLWDKLLSWRSVSTMSVSALCHLQISALLIYVYIFLLYELNLSKLDCCRIICLCQYFTPKHTGWYSFLPRRPTYRKLLDIGNYCKNNIFFLILSYCCNLLSWLTGRIIYRNEETIYCRKGCSLRTRRRSSVCHLFPTASASLYLPPLGLD